MKNEQSFRRPRKFDYNLIVIGAGSAGLVASAVASSLKAKVALIEENKMGGDCLNTGCVPSKTLIEVSKVVAQIRKAGPLGVSVSEPVVDFSKVMTSVRRAITTIAPHDSKERFTSLGVDCFSGKAEVLSPFEVEVNDQRFTCRHLILATGAQPKVPSLSGLEKVKYRTSETLWSLDQLPARLVIVGGGAIGCEMAQAFARLGSKVILLEFSERLLAQEDVEVSEFVRNKFKDEGIEVLTGSQILDFPDACRLRCQTPSGLAEIPFDELLFAVGRKPRLTGFGLEKFNLQVNESGGLKSDPFLRTQYSNIWVCGDVTSAMQLTSVAGTQGSVAALNALFSPFLRMKGKLPSVPWCVFTDPEIARVGLNESQAIKQRVSFDRTWFDIRDLDRAVTSSKREGFVKVLTKKGSDKILGVTAVGDRAGDWISELAFAMKMNVGLRKVLGTPHAYPTWSEANHKVSSQWQKERIPQALVKLTERYFKWQRGGSTKKVESADVV